MTRGGESKEEGRLPGGRECALFISVPQYPEQFLAHRREDLYHVGDGRSKHKQDREDADGGAVRPRADDAARQPLQGLREELQVGDRQVGGPTSQGLRPPRVGPMEDMTSASLSHRPTPAQPALLLQPRKPHSQSHRSTRHKSAQ